MNTELQNKHVADIVKDYPRTADVFRRVGIDYCCGGRIPLSEAVSNCKFDDNEVYLEVEEKIRRSGNSVGQIDMKYLSVTGIIEYIQNKYHKDLKEELVNLTPFVTRLRQRHGEDQPHLVELYELFEQFKKEMIEHTADEDNNVFPLIANYDDDENNVEPTVLETAVQKLIEDHDGTGSTLMRMREITRNYELPPAACGTYTLVYTRLEELEKQTFEHVHMENHILFEKVDELMSSQAS